MKKSQNMYEKAPRWLPLTNLLWKVIKLDDLTTFYQSKSIDVIYTVFQNTLFSYGTLLYKGALHSNYMPQSYIGKIF